MSTKRLNVIPTNQRWTNLFPDCTCWQSSVILGERNRDKFNSEFDKMLIEQIIARTVYPEVQKQLLVDEKMTLNKAIQMVKSHEASINYMKQ